MYNEAPAGGRMYGAGQSLGMSMSGRDVGGRIHPGLVQACAYLEANADKMGDVAEQIRAVYCSGKSIPDEHPVFCLVRNQAADIPELREMLAKDCAVECSQPDGEQSVSECIAMCEPMKEHIGAAVDALQALVNHMGKCPSASARSGGQEGGMIPQVPHYESFAVIRTLPHVPAMKPKEGTRLHYHGEPVDLTSAHGAAFDFETASLRVGSTVCKADEVLVDGRCRNRFILA